MSRLTIAALLGVPALAFFGAIAACADVLGFDDLHLSTDASLAADSPVVDDSAVPLDASLPDVLADAPPTIHADADPHADAACGPAQPVTLDAINAKGAVSASHVDTYEFAITQATDAIVRVRTGTLSADVEVGTTCDANVTALPAPTAAPDGVYTRGTLQPGTYFVRIAWDSAVAASTPYTFDVMRDTPAANTCAKPTALAAGIALKGSTFEGPDTVTGCPLVPVYGQLFYSVTIPANAAWEVTGTPGAWTMVLQALTACTSTTCAVPTAVSAAAGSPASLELNNTSAAAKTFLVGASASPRDGASGGGAFTIAAAALNRCVTEGAACSLTGTGVGLCCSGICEPKGVKNSCGKSCGAACPLSYQVCTAGACACPDSLSDSCPPACVDTSSDTNHCGDCSTHCTTNDPHAVGVSCTNGACRPQCDPAFKTYCNGLCVDLKTDNNNCGSCKTKCTGGRTCSAKSCECTTSANPDDCGGTSCTNLQKDDNNCGTCGNACSKIDPNATGTCNGSGKCTLVCKPGFKTCVANHPCLNVMGNDNANCGNCNAACTTSNPMMTATCSAGSCVVSCKPQFSCGGTCTDTQTDPANCGTCGHACDPGDAGVASCVGGVCQ